ncbi:MAG: 8-amino-7-oxononanoate synthase [bacterium]
MDLLQKRKEAGCLRNLHPASYKRNGNIYFAQKEYIDFSSNDYLGLANHEKLKNAAKRMLDDFGSSSSASRLLSGDLEIFHRLEEKMATFKGKESALVFNTGYQANLSIISALYKKGDVIFLDRLSHRSLVDGVILSGAAFFRFQHNDLDHLQILLKKHRNKFKDALIITEGVFSMDGDKAPLAQLIRLKDSYNCKIMLDEAHATGIFGKNGSGIVEEEGVTEETDLIMGTFSKALGSFGAYLACSKEIKDYLINFSGGFIYSTALPPAVIGANLAGLELLVEEPFRRYSLLENAEYLRSNLRAQGWEVMGESQIVPVIIGDVERTNYLSEKLKDNGYYSLPIRPPTVPEQESRIRFSLTYYHSKKVLEALVDLMSMFSRGRK